MKVLFQILALVTKPKPQEDDLLDRMAWRFHNLHNPEVKPGWDAEVIQRLKEDLSGSNTGCLADKD